MISINSEDLRRQILLNDCLKTLKDFSGTYIKYNIFLFYYLNLKDKAYMFWGYFLNSKLVLVKRVIYFLNLLMFFNFLNLKFKTNAF